MELIAQEGKQGVVGLAVENAAGLQGGLAALLDELAHGVIITTAEGRMLHANQAGRHELVRASAMALWKGGLVQACRPECDRELQCAFARAGTGRRSLLHLAALEGAGVTLTVLPLKPHAGDAARCALVLARGNVCDPLVLSQFARRHGITPAEQQVLANLCEGRSAPQVAAQLDVAVSTIRSHVRSICAKTRANGVRELVRRVAVLPPVAPTFPHEATH